MTPASDFSEKSSAHAILLVDDNVHGMIARRRVLQELGYQVQTAASAEQALELIMGKQERFDVLVTDYKMEAMNGIELIARVKALSPATKSILLSGFVGPLGLTEESTGADAVLPKCAGEASYLTRTVGRLLAVRKPPASQRRSGIAMVKGSS